MPAVTKLCQALVALCVLGVPAMCAQADPPRSVSAAQADKKAKQRAALYAINAGVPQPQAADKNLVAGSPSMAAELAGQDLFDPAESTDLEETLQRLLEDPMLQFDLRDNLKLECDLEPHSSRASDREVGMKIGLKYRF